MSLQANMGKDRVHFICALAIFLWSHASEKQHTNSVSSTCGKGLFFVNFILVTNSWLNFCLLLVPYTYLFLLGSIALYQQSDHVFSLKRGDLLLGDMHSSLLSLDASPRTVGILLSVRSLWLQLCLSTAPLFCIIPCVSEMLVTAAPLVQPVPFLALFVRKIQATVQQM